MTEELEKLFARSRAAADQMWMNAEERLDAVIRVIGVVSRGGSIDEPEDIRVVLWAMALIAGEVFMRRSERRAGG